MAKVLLVEDDNNLREIFEMRLQAEGYETVTAGDGEQALVVAMKEKPDLIIADVMMPRLSGFEMLESLRAAPGMADTKVVMMTALGQAEDQARGDKLGVVKYLVKSQVTLEDFARVIREVLPPDGGQASTKQGSEKKMDDNSSAPAPDQSGAPAADGQMSSDDATKQMNDQVNKAMGDDSAAPAADPAAPAADGDDAAAPAPEGEEKPAEGGAPADTSGSL